jgi:hypothetical protein
VCVRWCVAANPAEPLPHKRTAPVRMRRGTPEEASAVLSSGRARARVATPTDPIIACEHPIAHKRKAVAEAVIDTEALVCSGSRCTSP